MSNTVNVARVEIDLKLKIGNDFYDCATCNLFFGINIVPTAQAILAVGVCVLGGAAPNVSVGDPATIHKTAPNILHMQSAEIFLRLRGDWRPGGPAWPNAWTRVFKGYVTGFGAQKLRGSMRVTVNLVHWLSDLAFSSSVSGQTHASSCFQFSARAPMVGDTAKGCCAEGAALTSLEGEAHTMAQYTSRDLFTPGNIRKDLWANCIYPMLCCIASKDAFKFTPGNACFQAGGKTNRRGLLALKLMEGNAKCGKAPSKWYVPLAMGIDEAANAMASAISDQVSLERLDSCVTHTLWDKLVNYAGLFGFTICPRVETAIIAPFTAGLQQTFIKALWADDLTYQGIEAQLAKPLRGVQVLGNRQLRTFQTDRTGPPVFDSLGAGGCYAPPGIDDDGLVLIREAPAWMTNVGIASMDAKNTVLGNTRRPHSTATTPRAGFRGNADGQTMAEVHIAAQPIYQRVAHWYYMQECLRGRFGVCYGKLRFDIAPGSTILVQNTQELHLAANDKLGGTDYVGDVTRVSMDIDAEGVRAGTGFQLANVRTTTENDAGVVSVPGHPLYDDAQWPGCPLIDAYLFPDD